MLGAPFERRGVVSRRVREARVGLVFGDLGKRSRRPEQGLGPRRGVEGGGVIEREEAPLQLPDPVPAGAERHARMRLQAPLELALVEPIAVERREIGRRSPELADQPQLRGDDVHDQAELRAPRERDSVLGGALDLSERIAGREQQRDRGVARVGRGLEVAGLQADLEGAALQLDAASEMFGPAS